LLFRGTFTQKTSTTQLTNLSRATHRCCFRVSLVFNRYKRKYKSQAAERKQQLNLLSVTIVRELMKSAREEVQAQENPDTHTLVTTAPTLEPTPVSNDSYGMEPQDIGYPVSGEVTMPAPCFWRDQNANPFDDVKPAGRTSQLHVHHFANILSTAIAILAPIDVASEFTVVEGDHVVEVTWTNSTGLSNGVYVRLPCSSLLSYKHAHVNCIKTMNSQCISARSDKHRFFLYGWLLCCCESKLPFWSNLLLRAPSDQY